MTRLAVIFGVSTLIGAGSDRQATVFRSGVESVRVDVSVLRGGQPVRGLTADDFVLTDNKVPQRIEAVAVESLGVNVFMVLDTSGSVAGQKLGHLIDAGKALVAALRPADRVALMTFSGDITQRVALTPDGQSVASALDSLTGNGPTALRDAVQMALQLPPSDDSRSVILLFTDGQDSTSWLSTSDLLTAARRQGVVIHTVSIADAEPARVVQPGVNTLATRPAATAFLQRLVTAAGGRLWAAASPSDLRTQFVQAIDEMRARYLLSFSPQEKGEPGWHDLKVTLKRGRGDVTARPGYFRP